MGMPVRELEKPVMRNARVLIVEDSTALGETYRAMLLSDGHTVDLHARADAAIAALEKVLPAVLLIDVNLPDGNGLDILRLVKARQFPVEVVMMTAQGSVQLAVEAMREGAFDFIMKPFSTERLKVTVRNAIERRAMANTLADITETFDRDHFANFIGRSLPMQATYRIIQSAAPSNATVFITGESGTGKELCAEALHRLSRRANGPFVAINCAAIPRDMLESEIFGHSKGAFTGAISDRKGAVLQAHGGTLFLDELCEMDLGLQAKMLRFLQTMTIQRVGEDQLRQVDVRIVCATNRDPQAEVAAGRFREDLFYRLHVVPIELPPLRDRDDDVLLIAREFLSRFAQEDGKIFTGFTAEAEAALCAYSWPGNVRQLQNVIRNVVVLAEGPQVVLANLSREVQATMLASQRPGHAPRVPASLAPALRHVATRPAPMIEPLETSIRRIIEAAIDQCGGSIPRAAAALDVAPSTLYRRIQSWQMGETGERLVS
jgi:two-component system, repressor protein LuxO